MKTKHINVILEEEQMKKFKYISKENGRTVTGQARFMVTNFIKEFEKENGKIELPPSAE